ncbi:MAG TPA: aminodeoxychorismate synthase component I [Phycisphaerae bacterium]|nr:aminodeoxychorismate synthase component I [Phycisphaerae bacterium]
MSFQTGRDPFVLESSASDPTYGRFTILGCDPVHTFTAERGEPLPIDGLAECARRYPACRSVDGVPFVGGWVGYLSYEAGLGIENIRPTTRQDIALPPARFCLYDTAAVFDHLTGRWHAAGVEWPPGVCDDRPPLAERLADVSARLAAAGQPPPVRWDRSPTAPPESSLSRGQYLDLVERAKRYIEAGDIYQVNLSRRLSTTTTATPLELYRRVRQVNPSGYAALLQWDNRAVISGSPELFLDLRGERVVTRPIKGTRPRVGDEALDAMRRGELLDSEKDRAELTMIVDLLRNDLGRVCRFGSVRVISPADLEEHPTVYHLVGTIEGRLGEDRDWADLLRACFPGGSITGAPKVRAMQIIDELEPLCRSVYCGSIGYIGLDGSMCLNIAIRTMILDDDRLHLFAGGAIVADSDAADEFEETEAKAAGLLRAIGHGPPRPAAQPLTESAP